LNTAIPILLLRCSISTAVLVAAANAAPVRADSLSNTIQSGLDYSPLIASARSRLDGCEAQLVISRAEGLPSVHGTLRYSKELNQGSQTASGLSIDTAVNIPLYRGGSVRNDIRATEAQCAAATISISEVEAEVTLSVARVYADVLLNRRIVELNRQNVQNLATMLLGVSQRLAARDLTRTDVNQAESRLSLARGRLESSLASMEASEVEFERLVGKRPEALEAFPGVSGIPLTPESAAEVAISENPGIIAARSDTQSSRFSLRSAKGDLLPQLFATVNSSYSESPAHTAAVSPDKFGTTVGVTMRMSLFEGGRKTARVRAAAARVAQSELQSLDLERNVSSRTRAAYAEWTAARAVVEASRQAVAANQQALEGVRLENAVGTRTILEILNAEQELRDAQIQLATAERDHAVASVAILAAMGKARPGSLNFAASGEPRSLPPVTISAAAAASLAPPASQLPVARPQAAVVPDKARASIPAEPTLRATLMPALPPAPPAGWVLQLGAFETLSAATAHWNRIRSMAGGTTSRPGTRAAVFRIELSGRMLFRLIVLGFGEWQNAETECLSLKHAGAACIVKKSSHFGEQVWSSATAK
jgi:outer membrane protein